MPGFNLSIGSYYFSQTAISDNLRYNKISGKGFSLQQFTIKKFENDKLFAKTEKYLVVLEGVILNKHQLLNSGKSSWLDKVIELYEKIGDTFFKDFKGSFSGALFDKKQRKWVVFTDQIGSKHIYFAHFENNIVVSSEIKQLYDLFKENKISYNLNIQAAYMLLSYGYMLDDNTLCSEIKKLLPGHYLVIKNGNINVSKYFSLPEEYNDTINENDAIEEIDYLFRQAIKLQFDKDLEYSYKHLVALSGGLDSRMTSWVAHEMGYTEQLNFTFSQSDYLEETIAKKIAADLKHEWIFKALDNGLFLKDIDEINRISGGHALYYGLAHGNSMLKYINFQNLGLLHSGQLGDVIVGSFISNNETLHKTMGVGAYSRTMLNKLRIENYKLNGNEFELLMFNRRCFNGANTGLLASQIYSDTFSPFYDISFLNYCLSVNAKFRSNHKLYSNWILTKYPIAATYIREGTKTKPGAKTMKIKYRGKTLPIKRIIPWVLLKMGVKKTSSETRHHMNPLGYWYKTNADIKLFQDNYFNENISGITDKELRADCEMLYSTGTAIEKNQVLTLLSAVKLFW